ncbi:MAG: hypothetical protein JXB29_01710 [Sedimentisphaerales bacterium]|nr:hypothetical protein [Sedimentisphaerales bacterium]
MVKVIFMSVITVGCLIVGIGQSAVPYEENNTMMVLENFKNSFNWADSVSMKFDISSTPTGFPGKGLWKLVFVFNRDHNRVEWNGNGFIPDSNGNPDPNKNAILRVIITARESVSVVGNPGRPPLGASITTEFKGEKEDMLEQDELGGPLFGRTSGNSHKSVTDLLGESGDLHLRQGQEDVNGISCNVLEGTTKYGKVTAWVAPSKGYAALKWKIEKTGDDFINDTPMSKNELVLWVDQFECKEIQQIGQYFIPTKSTFDFANTAKDGSSVSTHCDYTVSDIQLNPDFNTIGAFKIDLPEGTRVTVPESPGIQYIWKGGKVVPDADAPTFEEIDKMVDELNKKKEADN